MPEVKSGRTTSTKATCTDLNRTNLNTDNSTISESDSEWKCPGKLRQDVQTIIDIMGPSLSPNYNTSSEADNEESVFSNSKVSSQAKCKETCSNDEDSSEKTDSSTETPSKLETNTNISTVADVNTTTQSATLDGFVDSKISFPYVENFCTANQYGGTMCPPPLIPANLCINSECLCPQVASVLHGGCGNYSTNNFKHEEKQSKAEVHSGNTNNHKLTKDNKDAKTSVVNWFKSIIQNSKIWEDGCPDGNTNEYYKMNVKKKRGCDNSAPRRVVFELVSSPQKEMNVCNSEEVCIEKPVVKESKHKKNLRNEIIQTKAMLHNNSSLIKDPIYDDRVSRKPVEKTTYSDTEGTTRVDVYYFDHGSFKHYQTTDAPPHVTSDGLAEKTEKHTTRFWAEIFGGIHIGFSFVTSFILQLFRFILYSILRPLTIGFIQLASDYFFKPFLATVFNAILQPIFIFIYNIVATLRDICDPISEGLGYFLREFAVLIRSFRIVDIYQETCKCSSSSSSSSKENVCDKKTKKNCRCTS